MAFLIFNWEVKNFKTILWTKGVTIFRTFQVFKDVGMFVRGEMFRDGSGKVSVGVNNIFVSYANRCKMRLLFLCSF